MTTLSFEALDQKLASGRRCILWGKCEKAFIHVTEDDPHIGFLFGLARQLARRAGWSPLWPPPVATTAWTVKTPGTSVTLYTGHAYHELDDDAAKWRQAFSTAARRHTCA